ncbi:calcium-binding protein [Xanthobacter sp. V4C-4]|uniref:calcium-binding protein n=1 Tax=Xanthobacter cornucopiae TaxID=3119924 RepID=UPI0037271E51
MATYSGTPGNDELNGGDGDDLVLGKAGDDFLNDTEGNDILDGGAGNDTFGIGPGLNTLIGGDGKDGLSVWSSDTHSIFSQSTFDGGDGFDWFYANYEMGTDAITLLPDSADGSALVFAVRQTTITLTNVESVTIFGGDAGNTLTGGAGDDVLYGGAAHDTLTGGAGDDVLYGGDADDVVNGGAGNDSLTGGLGNDRLDGGDGDDSIRSRFYYPVDAGKISVERDIIDGGAGNDEALIDLSNERHDITFTLDTAPNAVSVVQVGSVSGISVKNVENVVVFGGDGDDTLTGGDGEDCLMGGRGSDTLSGGDGDDRLVAGTLYSAPDKQKGVDVLDGGAGRDIAQFDFSAETRAVTFSFKAKIDATSTVFIGGAVAARMTRVERVEISGGRGDDVLITGSGDDILEGGAGGKDTLNGGAGNDKGVLNFSAISAAVTFTLADNGALSVARIDGRTSSSLRNIETASVTGGAGNDALIGAGGNDYFDGGDGDDVLTGAAGRDVLSGDAGNDTLIGGADRDRLYGGAGNDIYVVDAGDIVGEDAYQGGIDTIKTALEAYALRANFENLTYTGAADFSGKGNGRHNTLTAGAGRDTLDGAGGNDTLIGGAGADALTGGKGADLFVYVDLADSTATATDVLADFSAAAGDRIDLSRLDANTAGGTSDDAFTFIGRSTFSGTAGELRANGSFVQADTDGDRIADLTIRVTGGGALTASAFVL